jgi:hypothetical protein
MARYELTEFEWKVVSSRCCPTSHAVCRGLMIGGLPSFALALGFGRPTHRHRQISARCGSSSC